MHTFLSSYCLYIHTCFDNPLRVYSPHCYITILVYLPRCEHISLVSLPCCDILLLISSHYLYLFSSPCLNRFLPISIIFSLSLLLVKIYFLIFVAGASPRCGHLPLISSPRLHHFTSPCCNFLLPAPITFIILVMIFIVINPLLLVMVEFVLPWFLFIWSTIRDTKNSDKGANFKKSPK